MSEKEIVQKTEVPATVESLQADLRALGVKPGMVVLVHSSLSAMGWVCGGSVAVIAALQKALGSSGTLVMPAHSPGLTEPSGWESPPVPESWWPVIREHMPAYDPELTPTRSMGIIAETFRKQKGVLRSAHPQVSFCACGPQASRITNNHAYWPLVWASIRRLRESTICTVLSFFSVSITEIIRPCTLRNIGRLFQPNASSSRARQSLRRIRGDGPPLKMLTSTVQILIASARTFCDRTRAMSFVVAGLVLQIVSSCRSET